MFPKQPDSDDTLADDASTGLLSHVGDLLETLGSYTTTLQMVARLAVPQIADYCIVHLLESDGSLRQAAAAHRAPESEPVLSALQQRQVNLPPDHPILRVIDAGRPQIDPDLPNPDDAAWTHSPDLQAALSVLAPRSVMRLPLAAHGKTLGVISCFFSDSRRRYADEHVGIGLEFARRCALAVDNARLYEAERAARQAHEAALQQVRQREARLSGIIGAAMDAIITIGPDLGIHVFNATAERMFGYTAEEIMNRPVDILVPERFRRSHAEHIRRFGETGTTYRRMGALGRLTGRRSNGEEFPIEATISRVKTGNDLLLTVVIRDVTEQAREEGRQTLLAEAGAVLASSLDFETTLEQVASLAVPTFADYCFVDILQQGQTRRIAIAHADPTKARLVARLREFPPDLHSVTGAPAALRTGVAQLEPEVTEAQILAMARGPEHLAIIHELGPRSRMFVPLIARGELLGAVAFVFADTGRKYTSADLALAEELARRCALAIDNARLYQAAGSARDLAEAAHAALKLSEARFRGLFEASPGALLVLDAAGAVRDANPAAAALLGRPRETLRDVSIDDLCGPGTHKRLADRAYPGRTPSQPLTLRQSGTPVRYLQLTLTDAHLESSSQEIQVLVRDVTVEEQRQAGLRALAARILQAQEEERARIARDLHDETIQTLIYLCRRLDAVAGAQNAQSQEVREALGDARKSAERAVAELRDFARMLRPPTLQDFGLVAGVGRLLIDLGERTGLEDHLTVLGKSRRLSEESELTLFRITQEALRNVERHAEATNVTVRISFEVHGISLEITDDGKGFALPAAVNDFAASGHLGLLGMQERAQLLGGQLRIQSSIGRGTTVHASLPVPGLPGNPASSQNSF